MAAPARRSAGPDQRPVTVAALDEVLRLWDHADLTAMQAYVRRYGLLAEGSLLGWQNADQAVEISAADFNQVCASARRAVDATI